MSRLTDKTIEPQPNDIALLLGAAALKRLNTLESWLSIRYELSRALKFPFGASYGWGYKYSHRQTHLCYAFLEQGAFTVTLQISDKRVPALEKALPFLQPATRQLWIHRYPCGKSGGWIHLRVHSDEDLSDAQILIEARKPGISRANAI